MCENCIKNGYLSMETYRKISEFVDKYPNAAFGPAHIVLDDCNVLDHQLRWCIGLIKAALSKNYTDLYKPEEDVDFMNRMAWYSDENHDELRATAKFLEELLIIPENER